MNPLLILLFCSSLAYADEVANNFIYGHNLTVTSDLLKPGHVALGLDIAAVGITENVTIGTSTWMWKDYNMGNIAFRAVLDEDDCSAWAIQTGYFKTFGERDEEHMGNYKMDALWNILIRTYKMAPYYKLHANFQVNYYWDQTMPFSLRRPSQNRTPWQVNLSSLHELKLIGPWIMLGEAGLVDIARQPMYLHGGASIGQSWEHFSWHLGFSLDVKATSLMDTGRYDYQQYLRYYDVEGYNSELDDYWLEKDYALHPEFSVQVLF